MSSATAELFIEIRCEELPARMVAAAERALANNVVKLLKGIEHGAITTWSTPRRLAVSIADVAEGRPVQEKLVTGPPQRAAFRDGAPTKTAIGFARGRGVAVEDLEIVESARGPVVAARVKTGGEKSADLIAAGLEGAVLSMSFPRPMRWGTGTVRWARPLHGVIALLGGQRIPLTVAGIESGCETLGHRLTRGPVTATGSADWLVGLRAHNVEPDAAARRADITAQLSAAVAALSGEIRDWDLVDEVVNLVECPIVVTASFGEDLLGLPPHLLVESMKVHQRVFPVYVNDALDHHFLVVSNQPYARQPESAATISEGNERVLTARFYDAKFFYAEDRKKTLSDFRGRLEGMQWIRKGGTMAEKADRIAALAATLAPLLGADADAAARAGLLCKYDLGTQMVSEFPKLQGHIGNLLAGFDGEDPAIAAAIEEHYYPRYQGDALPGSALSRTVAIADRLDSLAGCFGLGLKPKGSADPLGLRRATIGMLQILLSARVGLSISDLLSLTALTDDQKTDLAGFLTARLRGIFLERYSSNAAGTELVNAVMATGDDAPVALAARLEAMAEVAATPEFGPLKTTFKRVMGLIKDHASPAYDAAAMTKDAETALHLALDGVKQTARAHAAQQDYSAALAALSSLKPAVDRLFDEVLVVHQDLAVRNNRLSLLRAIGDEFRQIADFSQLSVE
ncbi:MAG: glycine--tRNA ligase subunit beta [Myxococcota bacterium]|nr:glycine--tRNA ligase subunit beta [Myxococcota bacterium]